MMGLVQEMCVGSAMLLFISGVAQTIAAHQLIDSHQYECDSAGRTTSVTTSAGTTTLTWDYEDRLVGITYPNTSTNSFSYNAFGARISKTDSSGTSTYARNGTSVIAPVLSDGSLTFTPGISTNNGSASTYSHGDIKNSLTQTGANETTIATKQYDAFGNPTSSTGTWDGPFQYGGPFGYQTDTDSNLKLLGHRYYDSSTGRFLSSDPVKDGSNWFAYCGNNPVGLADPRGLMPAAAAAPLITNPVSWTILGVIAIGAVAYFVIDGVSKAVERGQPSPGARRKADENPHRLGPEPVTLEEPEILYR